MDDRQLLELAAKAAGYEVGRRESDQSFYFGLGTYTPKYWNPLADDGDALRLMVTLKLKVTVGNSIVMVECSPCWIPDVGQEFDSDPHAATRRAIVRMAAEIGRGLVQEKKNADQA